MSLPTFDTPEAQMHSRVARLPLGTLVALAFLIAACAGEGGRTPTSPTEFASTGPQRIESCDDYAFELHPVDDSITHLPVNTNFNRSFYVVATAGNSSNTCFNTFAAVGSGKVGAVQPITSPSGYTFHGAGDSVFVTGDYYTFATTGKGFAMMTSAVGGAYGSSSSIFVTP